jgi:hypothetical protein
VAAETLQRMAVNDPITNGQLIKTNYGDAVQNPLVSIARRWRVPSNFKAVPHAFYADRQN